jgi:hypothetical protein
MQDEELEKKVPPPWLEAVGRLLTDMEGVKEGSDEFFVVAMKHGITPDDLREALVSMPEDTDPLQFGELKDFLAQYEAFIKRRADEAQG